MSITQHSTLLLQPTRSYASSDISQTHSEPHVNAGRIIFTRQLWQRSMSSGDQTEVNVLDKSQGSDAEANQSNGLESARRASAADSLRFRRRSQSSPDLSKTPLTPEESPPVTATRKRSAVAIEEDDQAIDNSETSPTYAASVESDPTVHVCICQAGPKTPRPRNAFILYRQHHQLDIVARNPGLANPEISKIIGQQWQRESVEQKSKWKALAEEEKLRHRQQYPDYRYQPKRNGRRTSADPSGGEKQKCQKCSGRLILTPSVIDSNTHTSPPTSATPGSGNKILSRTLPVLRDLRLDSPAVRQSRGSHSTSGMSPAQRAHPEERDELGPLSPETKRRKFNGDPPIILSRSMPPRYNVAPLGVPIGPSTPFPFVQSSPLHVLPMTSRRESLPGIGGVVSPPGSMPPPARPGMGYQQHRLSQGHVPQDASLTLPPLQTGRAGSIAGPLSSAKSTDEQIMSISFRYKIKVLFQVAPPTLRSMVAPRGPLIAVEGDNADAVMQLADWLKDRLSNNDGLNVSLNNGPETSTTCEKEEVMAQYHRLAAEWLAKSRHIADFLSMTPARKEADATMIDTTPAATNESADRTLDVSYDNSDATSSPKVVEYHEHKKSSSVGSDSAYSDAHGSEGMDLGTSDNKAPHHSNASGPIPVTIIPNYSLHTSNFFARLIPIGPNDAYAPSDHWQWTATFWRGIVGPDLTIYLRDTAIDLASGPALEMENVEGKPGVSLFVVRRDAGSGKEPEVEASVLRRVSFELGEWVSEFAAGKR